MRDYFLDIVRDLGIQTRIVECSITLEYEESKDSSRKEEFLQEYENLAQNGDIFSKAMQAVSKENNLMLELLVGLYQKLSKIENLLLQDKQVFLKLKEKCIINALGHGILCSKNSNFAKGGLYYLRFSLPNLTIGAFGEALDAQVMRLDSIHACDVEALDSYIATQDMEYLRQKRIKND